MIIGELWGRRHASYVKPDFLLEEDQARELPLERLDGSETMQAVSRLDIESKLISSSGIESWRLALG